MMRKGPTSGLALGLLALVLVAGACTSGGDGDEEGAATSVAVTLADFEIRPASIQAEAGVPLLLEVTNSGPTAHAMAVKAAGTTYETEMLEAGGSDTLEIPALDAGTYEVWCTVPGHPELGMTAALQVGAEAASPGETAGGTEHDGMSGMTPEEMAAAELAPIQAFPAETEAQGGQPLEYVLDGDVKVFTVHAGEVRWEVSPGEFVDAFGYEDQVPGPEIRVEQGDTVRVVLENELPQPTTIHFHGLTVPNEMDGVPFITQDPVMPGGTFTYEFTVTDTPGTYMYHSHMNALEQVQRGLFGALVVEPKHPSWDVEQTIILGDGELGYSLNGKSFPATSPIVAGLGDLVLVRFLNAGQQIHPMHLHGYKFMVINEDGRKLDTPYSIDTLNVGPGQRFDVLVQADYPGVWAFHCHILSHVESAHGMFGMVTALVVQ
jgi:FtsP/CotA-like multicopper oxidase with cupredoxin domain